MRFLPYVAAVVSGLLLSASFPGLSIFLLAWVALVPLLVQEHPRPFLSGWFAGLAFFAPTLIWITTVMTEYGLLHPLLAGAAYFLLIAYLALYVALPLWLACLLEKRLRVSRFWSFPFLWSLAEALRAYALTGFPWGSIGYSQAPVLSVIQIADICGASGIGVLILLVNAAIAEGIVRFRTEGWKGCRLLPVAALLLVAALFYGQPSHSQPSVASLKVGLIQGNIPQGIKWDPAMLGETIATYRDLSASATAGGSIDLLVWPESATPFYLQEPSVYADRVRMVPRRAGAPLLVGSPAYEAGPAGYRYLNSAFLLDPSGETVGRSDKIHLVPFGEYVPLQDFLPFVKKLAHGIGDFSPGTVAPLPFRESTIGSLICYEVIFPEIARAYVASGAGVLVNITNDAWFGRSAAPRQHLDMAVLRAVENRRWMLRSANTGISAIISPEGEISAQTGIFVPAALTGTFALSRVKTVYTSAGEWIPVASLILLAVLILPRIQTIRKSKKYTKECRHD